MGSVHLDRLRDAMQPDPAEWRYTGTVKDTGSPTGSTCACGQAIRYEFILERVLDGSTLVIGSQCIETSVPYLIEAGAATLAGELNAAFRGHQRQLREAQKRARDERARAALEPARTDLRVLIRWFGAARRQCRAEAAARGEEVIYQPSDIENPPRMPPDSDTPGRTLGAVRRSYTSGWLRALRYAHEYEAPLPNLPREQSLRDGIGKHVKQRAEAEADAFYHACSFARLAYRGDPEARSKVPPPAESRRREGYARRRRRERAGPPAEPAVVPGARNPRLDQLLASDAVGPDAGLRWRQFQDARSRGAST